MRRYTVASLTSELDVLLTSRYPTVLVEGEVGQVQTPASGHAYLVLRDKGQYGRPDVVLNCVVWRDDWNRLRTKPKPGDRVVARGRLSVWGQKGGYQLYANDVQPVGQGELQREIEARKARLAAEGLLDPRRKRKLPAFPRFVGVATSLTGAALQDFLKVSRSRFPSCRVLVAACAVQGQEAPSSVVRAVELLVDDGRAEVVVVARGGGSKEDLLPFHDEQLCRFLATCPVPVVSAVGHQIDETICDLVADVVAATPSEGAVLALPDARALARRVDEAALGLDRAVHGRIRHLRERLDARRARLRHPGDRLKAQRTRMEDLERRLGDVVRRRLDIDVARVRRVEDRLVPAADRLLAQRRRRLEALEGRLEALSPLAVLQRGYAIVSGPGGVVTDPAQVSEGDRLDLRVAHGTIEARVDRRPREGSQLSLLPK